MREEIRFDQVADDQEAPEWNPKLYVVTRKDLIPGAQACQAIHAFAEFQDKHPKEYQKWYKNSNYLAFLSVKDEMKLASYVFRAKNAGVLYAEFKEPDMDFQLTAVVFDATLDAREMLKHEESALKKNIWGQAK